MKKCIPSFTVYHLYSIGFVLTMVITLVEFLRGRHYNYIIFAESTIDFWNGISPYTADWVKEHGRYFLYSPIFSVLCSPFAFLPPWLGPFVWNLFHYSMLFLAIFSLPKQFSYQSKSYIFLFLLPILAQSLFSFQYNIAVAYLFIFAYSLLEREKYLFAILLIMISGTTKIYGVFQLILLVFYPCFKRNFLYSVLLLILFIALPLVHLSIDEFFPYYGEWFSALSTHQRGWFESIFYGVPFKFFMLDNFRIWQIGSLIGFIVLIFVSFKKWISERFRVQALGILMSWTILFSDSAELHTYIIALLGYMLWYKTRIPALFDRILLWSNFFLLCLVPIDIFVPTVLMNFLTKTLSLHIWVFLITWIRMIWITFFQSTLRKINEPKLVETFNPNVIDVVCPCYNPPLGFSDILVDKMAALRAYYSLKKINLIIVNDGSTRNFDRQDRNAILSGINDCQIVDIIHAGKGAAVRAGVAASTAHFTVYTDIDMPYSLDSMIKVIDELLKGEDIVVAVRDKKYYKSLSAKRKLMSKGVKILNCLLLNAKCKDTQGGLKCLSLRAKELMLSTTINDYLFDTEFIMLASQNKEISIKMVETTLRENVIMSPMSLRVMFCELKNYLKIIFT